MSPHFAIDWHSVEIARVKFIVVSSGRINLLHWPGPRRCRFLASEPFASTRARAVLSFALAIGSSEVRPEFHQLL